MLTETNEIRNTDFTSSYHLKSSRLNNDDYLFAKTEENSTKGSIQNLS